MTAAGSATVMLGEALEDWTGDARFFEYTQAANPLATGSISKVPPTQFPPSLHADAGTRIVPLDVSSELGLATGPATSPALCASFVCIAPGDPLRTAPEATSELYYVLRGRGRTGVADGPALEWRAGDLFTLPGGSRSTHEASEQTVIYWVTDAPLLRYLGVRPARPVFRPTLFENGRMRAELAKIAAAPRAADRNRISVLLANATQDQTLTVTHTLWAMLGLLPTGQVQRPHRHQSVALDLILDCAPGCYTLVGAHIDAQGDIVNPRRVDWEPGGAFITPPGLWHAHVNSSGADAHLLPVQDAGLQTYLRSLDIRFAPAAR